MLTIVPPTAGPEILQYLKDVSDKYKLDKYLRYGHCLKSASWDEKSAQWTLEFDLLDDKGVKVGQKTEVADVVIQGMGGLSRWDWPSIPGLKDFKVRVAPLDSVARITDFRSIRGRLCTRPLTTVLLPTRRTGGSPLLDL